MSKETKKPTFLQYFFRTYLLALDAAVSVFSPSTKLPIFVNRAIYEAILETLVGAEKPEHDIRARVGIANVHLEEAARIADEIRAEISNRNQELEKLLTQVTALRSDAEHWAELASTNEKLASALTKEIERRVGEQIRSEFERGKTRRHILATAFWVITLVAGGFAGVFIQKWWESSFRLPFVR